MALAAALDHDDFASRSDAKSFLVRNEIFVPILPQIASISDAICLVLALGGARIRAAIQHTVLELKSGRRAAAGDCCRAWSRRFCVGKRAACRRWRLLPRLITAILHREAGGVPPRAFAAALGHGDFASGSDAKSFLVRNEIFVPILPQIASISDAICLVLALGGARIRAAIQHTVLELKSGRRAAAGDCCRA